MKPSEIFDADFEGRALAELTLDVSQSWSAGKNIAGAMSAVREWVTLTFRDALPMFGAREKEVEEWIDRFSKSFFARMQIEHDNIMGKELTNGD
jgi:hypothetical protein